MDSMNDAEMICGATTDEDRAIALVWVGTLDQPAANVASAHVLATAHGIYELTVNGVPEGSLMNPGWTSYEWRLMVQDLDVTEAVRGGAGSLRLDVLLGNGWWRGKWGFERQCSDYGEKIGFLAKLEVMFADGSMQVVLTSADPAEGWSAFASPVLENSLYNGEAVDARLSWPGEPLPLTTVGFDPMTLVLQEGPLVRRQEAVPAQRVWKSPSGRTLVDFGQNLVGHLRFRVRGERGSRIRVRHAEVLEEGELGVRPLREARATDLLVCSGGVDVFEPTLTFHGFRYAEVEGWPGELAPSDVEAVVVHSDLPRIGRFECSNADVNRLVENSVWSQRGNFLSIPTDCPQRDEREGWTGDIAVFSPAACFNFDCSGFLGRWLSDLAAETAHAPERRVPVVVPDVIKLAPPADVEPWTRTPTAIWGDAAVWVPWALWQAYGEERALEAQYPGMVLHLESVERMLDADGLWTRGFQFGDWLDPTAPPEDPAAAKADPQVIAQACLYRSARIAEETARALDLHGDEARWGLLATRARGAFLAHYLHEDGMIESDAPAVYALALHFGLLDGLEGAAERAAARLAELVRENGYRIPVGFAGTPYITWALSEHGYVGDAYRLLLERECPSWLYPVTMGATTTWERWDSMLPNGAINPGGMTSFNHYALGAVCDWVYQVVGGLRPQEPGYACVLVKPEPGPGIDWARTSLETPHGRVEVSWRITDGDFLLDVSLPGGVPATVSLPSGEMHEVVGGSWCFSCKAANFGLPAGN